MNPLKHVAIIMDGNGRWGIKHKNSRNAGHREGLNTVEKVIKLSIKQKIRYLTLYAFSTENWNRLPSETAALMKLFENYIKSEIVEVHQNNLKFKVIGNKKNLPKSLISLIEYSHNLTQNNKGMQFNVCLDYGGKYDILEATKSIAKKIENKEMVSDEISLEKFKDNMISSKIEDLDLLIRTSGETRLSNFMLWQMAYSEIYFTDKLWPDFSVEDLDKAIMFYCSRDRRYGSSSSVSAAD